MINQHLSTDRIKLSLFEVAQDMPPKLYNNVKRQLEFGVIFLSLFFLQNKILEDGDPSANGHHAQQRVLEAQGIAIDSAIHHLRVMEQNSAK